MTKIRIVQRRPAISAIAELSFHWVTKQCAWNFWLLYVYCM